MSNSRNLFRRDFLKIAAASTAATLVPPARAIVVSNFPVNPWGTPGLYPGRVISMEHSKSSVNLNFQSGPIKQMIRSGMMALTGESNHVAAWRQFVRPGDVVGIKVNPNGNDATVSSPAAIMEIVRGLIAAGVDQKSILIYERYSEILDRISSWFPGWLRTAWASPAYTDDQTGITGYDPEHYIDLPEALLSWQDPNNPAHTRSYAAEFLTKKVNKIINLAVLKNHNAAGVTLALKNLSHGMTNNVDRSHPGPAYYYTSFIPAVVSMPVLRYKAVLHIVDGIHGIYEAGPNGPTQYTWEHKKMYFATDAVAIDRVGWRVIDDQRVANGLPVLAQSTAFMKPGPLCQPQYINSAGQMGLGEYRDDHIDLRNTTLG